MGRGNKVKYIQKKIEPRENAISKKDDMEKENRIKQTKKKTLTENRNAGKKEKRVMQTKGCGREREDNKIKVM